MGSKKHFSESEKALVLESLTRPGISLEEFKRVQAVYLRMKFDLGSLEIGKTLGLHASSVRRIHSEFFRHGVKTFTNKPHGGRCRANLSIFEEERVLSPFLKEAKDSGIITVSSVQAAYEEKLGRKVAPSTVYRVLERHDWRKIVPRPSHPKADLKAQEAFKKTSVK